MLVCVNQPEFKNLDFLISNKIFLIDLFQINTHIKSKILNTKFNRGPALLWKRELSFA